MGSFAATWPPPSNPPRPVTQGTTWRNIRKDHLLATWWVGQMILKISMLTIRHGWHQHAYWCVMGCLMFYGVIDYWIIIWQSCSELRLHVVFFYTFEGAGALVYPSPRWGFSEPIHALGSHCGFSVHVGEYARFHVSWCTWGSDSLRFDSCPN